MFGAEGPFSLFREESLSLDPVKLLTGWPVGCGRLLALPRALGRTVAACLGDLLRLRDNVGEEVRIVAALFKVVAAGVGDKSWGYDVALADGPGVKADFRKCGVE